MAQHSIRLVRAGTLEFPQFSDAGNRPLVLRPDAPLAVVSDEVLQNELVQSYLAQGTIVLLDEEGNPKPPPAAPELKSDAERGLGQRREEKPAGANPEDSTRESPRQPLFAPSAAGMPQRRGDRPAGANPEDGTAPSGGGAMNPVTGDAMPTTRAELNVTEEQRRKARGTDKDSASTSTTSPRTRSADGDPASADGTASVGADGQTAPSAIDTNAPTYVGAGAEGAHQKQVSSLNTTTGVASPQAAEELAGRRENTSTAEGAPTLQDSNETTGSGKKRRH